MDERLLKKIDARGRFRLRRQTLHGGLEFLLLTTSRPTEAQRKELRAVGCDTHFATGNVLTCSVHDASRLEDVARLSFVRGLTPREIYARHPQRFGAVGDVYHVKRNVLERLRHSGAIGRLVD